MVRSHQCSLKLLAGSIAVVERRRPRCCEVLRVVDEHLRGRDEVGARVPHGHRISVVFRSRYDVVVADVGRWNLLELHELAALEMGEGGRVALLVQRGLVDLVVIWVEEVGGRVHQGLLVLRWQVRAEVDCGVQGALERLRVIEVAVDMVVMRHQKLVLALLTSSSTRALLALCVIMIPQVMASDD